MNGIELQQLVSCILLCRNKVIYCGLYSYSYDNGIIIGIPLYMIMELYNNKPENYTDDHFVLFNCFGA